MKYKYFSELQGSAQHHKIYNYYKFIVIEQQSPVLKQNYKPDPYHKKKPETHTQAIPLWLHCSSKEQRGQDLAPLTLWNKKKNKNKKKSFNILKY